MTMRLAWQLDAERAMSDLTNAVIRAMSETGMKRTELAKELGYNRSRITQILGRKPFPNTSIKTAAKLARAVGLRFSVTLDRELP